MPKQHKGGGYTVARTVLQRPECAKWIGAIAAECSQIESTLSVYYAMLVFGKRSVQDNGEWIAMDAFESLLSLKAKRDFLVNAARRRFPTDVVKQFSAVLHDLQQVWNLRNDVIHGRWHLHNNEPDNLIWVKPVTDIQNAKVYSADDFIEILERVEKAADALTSFFQAKMLPRLERVAQAHVDAVIAAKKREQEA